MIKAIRPIPMIQPNTHIGHIIPPIIPPPMAIIAISAIMITPATIRIAI